MPPSANTSRARQWPAQSRPNWLGAGRRQDATSACCSARSSTWARAASRMRHGLAERCASPTLSCSPQDKLTRWARCSRAGGLAEALQSGRVAETAPVSDARAPRLVEDDPAPRAALDPIQGPELDAEPRGGARVGGCRPRLRDELTSADFADQVLGRCLQVGVCRPALSGVHHRVIVIGAAPGGETSGCERGAAGAFSTRPASANG